MTHHTQDAMVQHESGGMGFFSGVLLGGLVGAALALLLAPQSGQETMNMLRNKGLEIKDQVEQTAEEARLRAERMAHDLRSQTENVIDETRAKVQEKKEQVERTAEAATRSAQEAWNARQRQQQ